MVVWEFWDLTGRKDGLEQVQEGSISTSVQHTSFHFISFSSRTKQKAIPAKEGVIKKKKKNEAAKKERQKRKETNWPQTSQITLASFPQRSTSSTSDTQISFPPSEHTSPHITQTTKRKAIPTKEGVRTNKRSRKKRTATTRNKPGQVCTSFDRQIATCWTETDVAHRSEMEDD